MSERTEISRHEVETFAVLVRNAQAWKSNAEIAAECDSVAPRTVRAVTLKFVRLGILDQAHVFPGHRFRLTRTGDKRNLVYLDRLHMAAGVFGVSARTRGVA